MKSRRTFGHALGLGLACLTLGGSAPARAEEVADASESAKSKKQVPTAIEEITVTARKREESLQSTPISITAFGEQDLKNLDARKMEDIADSVPNLGFDRATSTASAARIRIRGVGNGDPIVSADPGVGVYVDGIYLARAQGAIVAVSDIERVEVLRGPQGTLFGKNTIGGAVNITTKKPELTEMGGYGEVRAGNYDRFDTRFGVNVPVVPERAAARFSFATATRDGFQKNKSSGPDLGDDKMLAGRAQFLVLPSESTELLLAVDHSREFRKPRGAKCKVTNSTPFGTLGAPAFAAFNLQSGALARCAEDDRRDTYSVASNLSFAQDNLRTYGASSTFTWNLSDDLTVKSLTGWRRQDNTFAFDLDGGPTSTFHFNSRDAGKSGGDQISQEFQLIGKALDDRLSYVAGVYGFTEKDQERTYLAGDPSFLLSIPPFIINQPLALRVQRLKVNNTSYAAFLQGTYDIDDQWSLDLGLRRTEESKRVDRTERIDRTGIFPNPVTGTVTFATASSQPVPGISFERSSRSDDWSPLARLNYQVTDDASTYVSWTRGFKSGGFNGRGDRPISQNLIDDEKITAYETGFKSQWLQNRLRFNASAFYNIYEDIQLTIPTATGGSLAIVVQNAGEAIVRGAELEFLALPWSSLQLTTSVGITNAKYTEFDDPTDPTKVDNQLPGVPTYSMNFGAQYGWDLGSSGNLTALANWTHIGRSGTDVEDSRILRQGKHGELDSQLVWALADGKTELSLWGNNLLGREYLDNGINFGSSFGNAVLYYNDPRTYGLEVRRTF